MVVLSVEGPDFADRGTWATHEILGVYPTEADAVASLPSHDHRPGHRPDREHGLADRREGQRRLAHASGG